MTTTAANSTKSPSNRSRPLVVRPVLVRVVNHHHRPYELHFDHLLVEGPSKRIPESIIIDATPLGEGDDLRVSDVRLPEGCEVIGIWFSALLLEMTGSGDSR